VIRNDLERKLYDGAVVMVGRGGRIECCETVGYADRESGRPLAEDDVFAIFSITKQMTAVTVLQGIERGAFTFRTPVAERVSYSPALAFAVLREVVRRSNGRNMRFRDILARDVFSPLDMTDSALGICNDLAERAVPVVVRDRSPSTLDPDRIERMGALILDPGANTEIPAAGVVGTAADVFTFAESLRRGGEGPRRRILSEATLAFAVQDHTGDMPNDAWVAARESHGWPLCPAHLGLGFFLRGTGDIPTPFGSLASPGTFGGIGAGSTVFWVNPERDITFVCLTSGLLTYTGSMLRFQRLADVAISSLV